MQKILSYLYPNRIEILANLTGFTVEYTNVYQKNVKIYRGIDNVLEFDIKNADQKRIDLSTLTGIELNVMDAEGNPLLNSPYTLTPNLALKGIATVILPVEDLAELKDQYLKFSLTASKDNNDVLLYTDSKFGAIGTMELNGSVLPTYRDNRVYDTFTGEIDLVGNVINHTSAIPAKFYEAVPTTQLSFDIDITGFIGTIWLEATTDSTISVNSYLHATRLQTFTTVIATTTTISFSNIDVGKFNYFRVLYQGDNPLTPTGTVDRVTVS